VNAPFDLGSPRARSLLQQALTSTPERLDLAALAVASLETPELELEPVMQQLDGLARRVAEQARAHVPGLAHLEALKQVLAVEEGFSGDAERYFAPENSFLPSVLERRRGLPISLSVVYLEVARRAGVALFGVSFPGHFVVASEVDGRRLVLDPFNGGRVLTEEGCEDLLKEVAPQVKFTPSMIAPAPVKSIAYRMLTNLKRIYLDRGDGDRALKVIDLMLVIAPDHPGELRARAAVLSALGAYRAALADIERCLELSPAAPDHQSLMLTAKALRERVEYLN
jgi:regulator of sirC expression with transglutaminase-like and TPR domain